MDSRALHKQNMCSATGQHVTLFPGLHSHAKHTDPKLSYRDSLMGEAFFSNLTSKPTTFPPVPSPPLSFLWHTLSQCLWFYDTCGLLMSVFTHEHASSLSAQGFICF